MEIEADTSEKVCQLAYLIRLSGNTAWFVSDLVGNPEDRFSHNEAHICEELCYVNMCIIISHFLICELRHQDNMSVCFTPPYTPLLYSNFRGIHYFLIFSLKHILRVLIRTTSLEPPQ